MKKWQVTFIYNGQFCDTDIKALTKEEAEKEFMTIMQMSKDSIVQCIEI
jgi:hypothetical protein